MTHFYWLDCASIAESVCALKRLFVFAQRLLPLDQVVFVGSTAVLILLSAVWLEKKSMKYTFLSCTIPRKHSFFQLSNSIGFYSSFIKALGVPGHKSFNYSLNAVRYKEEPT